MVRSYNGHYLGLSIPRREFDSPTHRQVLEACHVHHSASSR
jgi:hypothetical protein